MWVEEEPVKKFSSEISTKFIYDNIITRFGFPLIFISDQGSPFFNKIITTLTKQFKIEYQNSTVYHPQSNGAVEAFNKT